MTELARTAPTSFAATISTPSLSHLVSSVLGRVQATSDRPTSLLVAVAQLVVEAGCAANANTSLSPLAHLGWTAQLEEDGGTVEPDSPTGHLGESCLQPLLLSGGRAGAEDTCTALLEPLLQAAERVPSLVSRPAVLEAALQCCLTVATRPSSATSVRDRLQALQVVASLMDRPELRHRVTAASLEPCLLCCWHLLSLTSHCVLADDQDDVDGDEADDEVEEELRDTVVYAEYLLQSLLHSLGSPALPVLLSQVEAVAAASNNPPDSSASSMRAALAALRCCVVALPVGTTPHCRPAADLGLAALTAPGSAPGVRGEALALLGVLVQQYPDLQAACAPTLLPTFAGLLTASPPPRLSALTCRALISLCQGSGINSDPDTALDSALLVPHLPALVSAVVRLVHPGSATRVQRLAFSTLACLAQVTKSDFVPYYPSSMPLLLQALEQPGSGSGDRNGSAAEWRSAALEAATFVGEAIEDPALFEPDAARILQLIARVLQQQQGEDTWIAPEALWSACARVSTNETG